ncbi:MAG: flagellar hook capping protein [Eubacterium sp.]|nr:flagellar hook capping protein [Eubacterium sp.]
MANWAVIEDGKVVESTSQSSLKKASEASKNGMDKDAFLQLLVAQMQYQDPLEPTSNTEFISQYAQFSQVEELQNMAATSELARATSLVGQEVYIKTTDSAGAQRYVTGKVDYVAFEGNKAYLAIDEKLYSLDDLDTVADKDYLAAYNKGLAFSQKLAKLPGVYSIGLGDGETIDELEKTYSEMSEYEKSFIAKDTAELLNSYVERLHELRLLAGEIEGEGDTDQTEGEGDGTDSGEAVEGTEGTEATE